MKPAVPMLLAALALTTLDWAAPALAQNAGLIDRAREGANCPHCNLFQADFSSKRLTGRNFAGSRLRQADLSATVMNHTVFAGGDLRDVNAYGGVFSSSVFSGANLTHASFVGAYLQGAEFRGATLDGTNFSGAEMSRARGLTQRQLDAACGDDATTLPRGLSIPRCH